MNINPNTPNVQTTEDRLSFWRDKLHTARQSGDTELQQQAKRELASINAETTACNTRGDSVGDNSPSFSEG